MLRPLTAGPLAALLLLAACTPERSAPPTVVIPAADPLPVLRTEPTPAASATASAPREAPPIAWLGSEPDARDRARRLGLPLLVFARAEWDAAGLEMERKVWTDPRVRAAARPFVALRLDMTNTEGDAQLYHDRYELKGLPTVILFDASRRRVTTLTTYQSAEALAGALQRAAE